jgi:HK97 family phage major capsid protein
MATDKTLRIGRQYRYAQIDSTAKTGTRTFPLSFSNETPVDRFFGKEILLHGPGNVRMGRINAGAPYLFNHNANDPIGIVDPGTASIGPDRHGRASVTFFDTQRGQDCQAMSEQGMRNVSVGYDIHAVEEMPGGEGYYITDWEPMELSMAPLPAVTSVGMMRDDPGTERDIRVRPAAAASGGQAATAVRDAEHQPAAPAAHTRGLAMSDVSTAAAGATAGTGLQTTNLPNDGTMIERLRIKGLDALKRNHDVPGDVHQKWVDDGITVDEASQSTLTMIAERAKRSTTSQPSRVGMTDGDIKKYSISRAIRANFEKSWPKVAPFEAEISQALAARLGKQTGEHSFFVPVEVQEAMAMARGQRDMIVGTNTLGGYLVATQVQGFIDLLRNRSVVMRMGATLMPGLTGSVSVPKLTGSATAYWFANETGTATESTPTVGQMTLIPKTVGGYVEVSRQLLLQTAYNADAIINGDLAQVIGLAVDTAAISGPGTAGQPTGIMSTTGVGTSAPGTTTAISYADMIRFQTTVAGSNAFFPGFGYVTTPTVAGVLMGKPRFTNSDTPIWQGMISDGTVVGAPAMSSLQVGSGTVLAGDFSKVVIGEWGVLEIEANPYAQFQAGIIGIRALYTVDVGVRYGAAFSQGTGFIS